MNLVSPLRRPVLLVVPLFFAACTTDSETGTSTSDISQFSFPDDDTMVTQPSDPETISEPEARKTPVDTSPGTCELRQTHLGPNLVPNPSFEVFSESRTPFDPCNGNVAESWNVEAVEVNSCTGQLHPLSTWDSGAGGNLRVTRSDVTMNEFNGLQGASLAETALKPGATTALVPGTPVEVTARVVLADADFSGKWGLVAQRMHVAVFLGDDQGQFTEVARALFEDGKAYEDDPSNTWQTITGRFTVPGNMAGVTRVRVGVVDPEDLPVATDRHGRYHWVYFVDGVQVHEVKCGPGPSMP